MKKLYSFSSYFGRMGSLKGLFVEDEERVAKVIGKEVYYGEVLGKHSEIYDELRESDLKVINCSEAFVKEFEELNLQNGFNPIAIWFERNQDQFEEEEEEDV